LTALYPVNVRPLFDSSLPMSAVLPDMLPGLNGTFRLLFTRLLLVWIPVVGHGTLLSTWRNADELGRRLRARATIEPVAAKDK
jgi:hypothetical protein